MHWYLHHRRIFSTAEWKPGQIKRYSNGSCRIIYCGYCNRTLQDAKKHCSQRGNLRWRDERIHLRVDGCGLVVAVDSYALPLLQDFAETLGERLRRFPDDLPGEDISDGIHHDFGLLVAVVAYQLGEILKSQKHGHLVASRRRNQVVQALEIDGRQLVDDNRGFEFPLFTENSLCRGSL